MTGPRPPSRGCLRVFLQHGHSSENWRPLRRVLKRLRLSPQTADWESVPGTRQSALTVHCTGQPPVFIKSYSHTSVCVSFLLGQMQTWEACPGSEGEGSVLPG